MSIGLDTIRREWPDGVTARLSSVRGGVPVIINAVGYGDLAVVVLGVLRAEKAGKRFAYRTAASFVRLRGAVTPQPLLPAHDIIGRQPEQARGGLVVVGSHVPMSSRQIAQLFTLPRVTGIELPVDDLLRDPADLLAISRRAGQQLEQQLQAGRVAVLYTSRTLVTSDETARQIEIGQQVSHAITTALQEIKTRPRFILAKGGITNHDVAQKGLGAEQAQVIGQLFPGVPVWRLAKGPSVRFENVPYIIFPVSGRP